MSTSTATMQDAEGRNILKDKRLQGGPYHMCSLSGRLLIELFSNYSESGAQGAGNAD